MKCAVCQRTVNKGEGRYLYERLIHRNCASMLKRYPWRYKLYKKHKVKNKIGDENNEESNN